MPTTRHDPYAAVVEDLSYDYDGVFTTETVAEAVRASRTLQARTATVATHLPVLVRRIRDDIQTRVTTLLADVLEHRG